MKRLIDRVGAGRVLGAVTVLFVLCLALLGVLLYRIATEPPIVAEQSESGGADVAIGKFTPLAEPRPAPEVDFADQSGKTVALADFKGRVVLVNLWATWCAPCVKEMPSLARLQAKMGGLAILAVSEDRGGEKVVAPFLAKLNLAGLAIYLDPKNDAAHAFRAQGLPTSILIGRDGRIIGTLEGAADWDSETMAGLVRGYAERGRSGE
jgi:thiol-disulfide isomerase/thioredoxin